MLAIQKKLSWTFYALLSFPSTAMGFALSVQISALSWILSTQYGLKIEEVGLVWAAGPIAGIFGQVIIGVISDQVWLWNGRRRPFILIGGTLAALTLLALPNIDRIAAGLGFGGILGVALTVALTLDLAINISFNPTRSIIADVTPPGAERTKGYTWMQTISGTLGVAAYAIGAIWDNYVLIYSGAIGVLLMSVVPILFITEPRDLNPQDVELGPSPSTKLNLGQILVVILPLWGFLLYALYGMSVRLLGLQLPWGWVEGCCLVLTAFAVLRVLLQSEKPSTAEGNNLPGFQKVLAAHAFTWIGIQTMFVYMFAYVKDILPSLSELDQGRIVSWSFLIFNATAAILPALLLEPITRRIGRVNTHLSCIGIMALAYLLMYFLGKSAVAIYLVMALLGIGWAATVSLPFAIMSQKVDQSRMGLYMGLFNLAVVLPQLVASLGIGEAIASAPSKSLIFLICAGCLAVSTLAWYFVTEPPTVSEPAVASPIGGH